MKPSQLFFLAGLILMAVGAISLSDQRSSGAAFLAVGAAFMAIGAARARKR